MDFRGLIFLNLIFNLLFNANEYTKMFNVYNPKCERLQGNLKRYLCPSSQNSRQRLNLIMYTKNRLLLLKSKDRRALGASPQILTQTLHQSAPLRISRCATDGWLIGVGQHLP